MRFFLFQAPPGSVLVTPRDLTADWPGNATLLPPSSHVRYVVRSDGLVGEVVGDAGNGLLISARLAAELLCDDAENVTFIGATIESAGNEIVSAAHQLLRVRRTASLADLGSLRHGRLAAVAEAPGYIVVSQFIRDRLEDIGLSSTHFAEPLFAGLDASLHR